MCELVIFGRRTCFKPQSEALKRFLQICLLFFSPTEALFCSLVSGASKPLQGLLVENKDKDAF